MNDIDHKDDLRKAIDEAVDVPHPPTDRPPLRQSPARQSAPLVEQMHAFRQVRVELGERLRREGLRLENEYRSRREALLSSFASRLSETVARIESDRDRELAQLADEFRKQANLVAGLVQQMREERS